MYHAQTGNDNPKFGEGKSPSTARSGRAVLVRLVRALGNVRFVIASFLSVSSSTAPTQSRSLFPGTLQRV